MAKQPLEGERRDVAEFLILEGDWGDRALARVLNVSRSSVLRLRRELCEREAELGQDENFTPPRKTTTRQKCQCGAVVTTELPCLACRVRAAEGCEPPKPHRI